jgi:L-rhamnose mutarotase
MKSSYYYLIFQVIQELHALNSHVVTGMIMSYTAVHARTRVWPSVVAVARHSNVEHFPYLLPVGILFANLNKKLLHIKASPSLDVLMNS